MLVSASSLIGMRLLILAAAGCHGFTKPSHSPAPTSSCARCSLQSPCICSPLVCSITFSLRVSFAFLVFDSDTFHVSLSLSFILCMLDVAVVHSLATKSFGTQTTSMTGLWVAGITMHGRFSYRSAQWQFYGLSLWLCCQKLSQECRFCTCCLPTSTRCTLSLLLSVYCWSTIAYPVMYSCTMHSTTYQ